MTLNGASSLGVRLWAMLGGCAVLALVGSALFGEQGVGRHERLREELERLERLNGDLSTENKRLRVQAKALRHDREYIQAVIRDELGWVRADEVLFKFEERKR